ncbi:MAG: glycosyltransferase family 4 protein [Acidobacteriota bacterium]
MDRILNIAIDSRILSHPKCGIGRYTTSIVRELAARHSPHRIFLYSHQAFTTSFPIPAHWKIRTGNVRRQGLSTAFTQLFYPVWAVLDKIDVFWAPMPHLPVFMPPRIRKVITVHDMVVKRFPETMTRGTRLLESSLTPLSFRIADHLIAVSRFTLSEVLAFFPGMESKIEVVHLASSINTRECTVPCPIARSYFLFVGSYEPRKNLERTMAAYVQYRKSSRSPIDFVVAGSDQWGSFSVEEFIRTNNLQECVHVIRHPDDDVLAALYANARALVLVSLYEGFGLPLVEAMQCGTPLIASNTSAVAEVAGNAALVVNPLDTDSIAQAFKQMTEDENTCSLLAHNAKIRSREFSWSKTASETLTILSQEG